MCASMRLITELYLTQAARWPKNGRHILAQFDAETVVLYQAYNPVLGHFAAAHGFFGDGFRLSGMCWIKPNFTWMMHRSGWGTKTNQEIVLAVWLKRPAFDSILAQAVISSFDPDLYPSQDEWQYAVQQSSVRLQWDPDYDLADRRLNRRAIQLGLSGDVLKQYSQEWIDHIEDISQFVAQQRQLVQTGTYDKILVPRHDAYPISDPNLTWRLKLSPVEAD
jgi:hypothetical protein